MKYTVIHPSIDLPKGRAREFLDKFIASAREGGGEEIAVLAELFLQDEGLPNVNYLAVEKSAVHKLTQEFLNYLASFKSQSNPLPGRISKRNNWKGVPLYACGIGSATSGIAAALMANGVTSGEVITTSLNFLGVPNAIVLAGATPVFADIDPETFCMDWGSLEKSISKNTKAIVLVHFNQAVDLEPVYNILEKKGLEIPVIQDASLAMGSTCKGMPAGIANLGKGGATVYSFATSKILSGLGGAIVVANELEIIKRIRSVEYQGVNFENPEEMSLLGANFKMNDLNAAIVLEQLKKREAMFEKRRLLKSWFDRELADVVDTGKIKIQKTAPESIVTHYGILLPERKSVAKKMLEKDIYLGMWHCAHLQSVYQKRFGTAAGTLPVTESVADRLAFLPFHTRLAEKDVSSICNALKQAL